MRPLENALNPLAAHPASRVEADSAAPQFHLQDLGRDTDGKLIEWPELEGYDEKHGINTARLSWVILSYTFPKLNQPKEQAILWTAALFHDLARREDFRAGDLVHAKRGAELLECILRNPTHGVELDAELREAACRLVANHNLDAEQLPTDPLAQCLWDADAYESCRIRPGSHDGLMYLKKRTHKDRLCTDWAKDRNNLKRYMNWRGW